LDAAILGGDVDPAMIERYPIFSGEC